MTDSKSILELVKHNNGIITSAMVVDAGFSRGSLKYLSDKGMLENVSRGVYALPDAWDDEFVNIQNRYKRGIYSLGTALFLCNLTDRTPARFHMTFPATYNLTNPKRDGILCCGSKDSLYSLGVAELTTPGNNRVAGYCAERTLCDILRTKNHVDMQLVSDAFKKYTSGKCKNIPLLSKYSAELGVEEKLRTYLEVLL